eukprot:scaffold1398_cov116-Cylindrotheca_fusiformis.AAC.27
MANYLRTTEPLVLQEIGCSYDELCLSIAAIPLIREQSLPQEIICRVADFFTVDRVQPENVTAISATSHDNRHDLNESLTLNKETWWISSLGSMPHGKGEEYVEFELARKTCRLSTFKIEIPPLPSGPLSVRNLRLDCLGASGAWETVSSELTVANRTGLQEFHINPPVDTRFCRVVCLTNQISQFLGVDMEDEDLTHDYTCVGYFTVRFE